MADFKTCEDCVGYQFCSSYYTESEIKGIILGGDIRNLCGWFEDKENFVEVVRCKDCKHFSENGTTRYCEFHSTYWEKFIMRRTDFCSYGERKE